MSMTEKERRAYEDYMISVHAARDAWETIRDEGWEEGWEEGHEKGFEKGFEDGQEKGRAEGRAEANRDIAKKMIAMGMDDSTIAEATGLTLEEIQCLR
jgi:predicted transposase/invertase (TIGR01784 family)